MEINESAYGLSLEHQECLIARAWIRSKFRELQLQVAEWEPRPYVSSGNRDPRWNDSCGCSV